MEWLQSDGEALGPNPDRMLPFLQVHKTKATALSLHLLASLRPAVRAQESAITEGCGLTLAGQDG